MKTETPRLVEFLIVTGILSLVSVGMFGAFGAIVHYLYTVVKNEGSEFKFGAMAT
jgi:nitrate reductase NapE component